MRPAIQGEAFGVADPASLSNLRDIVEPAGITWWPPAPGVVLLAVLILLWTAVAALLWWRNRQRNAYRRAALHDLAAIGVRLRSPQTRTDGIRQLSVLLKRVALAAYPRADVASLTGNKWIAFLDQHLGSDLFRKGPGRVLSAAMVEPNSGADLTPSDCDHMVKAVQQWITGHRVEDNASDTDGMGG
jgi:hypothetical protein